MRVTIQSYIVTYTVSSKELVTMRQLENVSEELAASYFSSKEVVTQKFSNGISGENPYWEDDQVVPSLSDLCIKTLVKCFCV